MHGQGTEHVDFLVDANEGELPRAALSFRDACVQWGSIPPGALRGMEAMVSRPSGASRELHVGQLFGVRLHFVEREGVFSFKAVAGTAGPDLLRIDLPPAVITDFLDSLADAIEVWDASPAETGTHE